MLIKINGSDVIYIVGKDIDSDGAKAILASKRGYEVDANGDNIDQGEPTKQGKKDKKANK